MTPEAIHHLPDVPNVPLVGQNHAKSDERRRQRRKKKRPGSNVEDLIDHSHEPDEQKDELVILDENDEPADASSAVDFLA